MPRVKDAERIRALFLQRANSYSLSEASRLLGISRHALIREAVQDRREEYKVGREWRFTWRQLAYVAFHTWSLAEIHEALGADAAGVLPPLLELRALTVRLPEYIVRALELRAADERTTVDDVVYYELVDFAGTVSDRYGNRIRGYREAYFYPGRA